MDYDESKKVEVEISENQFVENRINRKTRKLKERKSGIDMLDIAIVPVVLGVFVSLGFLFANIFKASAVSAAAVSSIIAAVL